MASSAAPPAAPNSRRDFAFLLAAAVLLMLLANVVFISGSHFTLFHLQDQDLPIALGAGMLFVLLYAARIPAMAPPQRAPTLALTAASFGLLALVLWWLTYALMGNFGVSYDEYMVLFDMDVYAAGQLAQPLAQEWRDYARNLVPAFLLTDNSPSAVVSAYLPANALLRLAFSQVVSPALMNPLLFAAGGLALYDIARRHFGTQGSAILVALLLYALSMQAWAAAMTPYAMTGHLALNLVWLAAFLRGGRWHVMAIAVGIAATGLHQLVFHPLFVAPFLLQRLLRGEYRLVVGYSLAYAVILAGWIVFPMLAEAVTSTAANGGASQTDFVRDRLLPLLTDRNPITLQLMILNVLRFFSWQHLALLPLMISAWPLARNRDGLALPLFVGIALAILMPTIVLPYQGHGWGYRYLHGYIGSFSLLGAMGYGRLRDANPGRAWATVVIASFATLVAMAWLTYRIDAFVAPHVALERHIAAIDADLVIIETEPAFETSDGLWAANAIDLVRNRPDLSNRPIRLSSQLLTVDRALTLCDRGRVAFVDRDAQKAIGFSVNQPATSRRFAQLEKRLRAEVAPGRCRIVGRSGEATH